jgi:hypothetical protein
MRRLDEMQAPAVHNLLYGNKRLPKSPQHNPSNSSNMKTS